MLSGLTRLTSTRFGHGEVLGVAPCTWPPLGECWLLLLLLVVVFSHSLWEALCPMRPLALFSKPPLVLADTLWLWGSAGDRNSGELYCSCLSPHPDFEASVATAEEPQHRWSSGWLWVSCGRRQGGGLSQLLLFKMCWWQPPTQPSPFRWRSGFAWC